MDPGDASRAGSTDVDFVALAAGQMVGRYEIVATLGQGGFGITYRARDTRLGRDVAIKEYLPSALAIRHEGATVMPRSTRVADDFTWGRDRFVAEGQTLASLQDAAAIVRVFDFLEANGTAYIVMQLLSGETLDDLLKRNGKLTPSEMDRILWPLLDGLEHVHNAGFLHRDIKPANILLDSAGKPTLIDFGASRAAMADRTVAMTAIFTPGYAAAEQFTSARQGPWTDIYGLAATLYQAMTGRVPPSAIERILQDDYEPLAAIRPAGFPPGLLLGIDAGLVVRAGDRPQSIAVWRRMLSQVNESAAATLMMPRPSPPAAAAAPTGNPVAAKPFAPKKVAMWSAASAAVLLIAAGGYWALAPSKPATVDPIAERVRIEQQVQRAEAETKRKAEAEAAEKLRAEEEARRQAAQTERQRVEAEAAREKAEADAAAQRQAEADEARRKAEAEAAERDRIQQEVQKARDALAAAEAARKQAEAEAARLRAQAEAAAAAAEKKRLEDEARQQAPAASTTSAPAAAAARPPQPAATAPQPGAARDGLWFGALDCKSAGRTSVQGSVSNGAGTLAGGAIAMRVQITGDNVSIAIRPSGDTRSAVSGQMSGKISGRGVYAQGNVGGETCTVSLVAP